MALHWVHTPLPVESSVLLAMRACCASFTLTMVPQPGSITRALFSGGNVLRDHSARHPDKHTDRHTARQQSGPLEALAPFACVSSGQRFNRRFLSSD